MSIARSPSSRESTAGAEWRCAHIGNFRKLLPHGDRPFSWINPLPIWRSRNDTLARLLGDPRNYGRLFSLGHIGHWLGFGRPLVRFWFIPPDQAAAIMGQRLGITPTRPGDRNVRISWRTQFVASWLAPLPGQLQGPLQPLYSELLDWNDPPMFKSFLRLNANAEELTITCFPATGCLEQETLPPVEDEIKAVRQPDGTWRWTTGAA